MSNNGFIFPYGKIKPLLLVATGYVVNMITMKSKMQGPPSPKINILLKIFVIWHFLTEHLFTGTSGKQCVLTAVVILGFILCNNWSRGYKTHYFLWYQ